MHISQKKKEKKKKQFIFYVVSNMEYYNNNSNPQFIYFQYIENTFYQCIMSSGIISARIEICYHCESYCTYVVHMQGWNFFQNYMDKKMLHLQLPHSQVYG